MEFCMAILLLDGKAGLPEFTDEVVHRPDVKAMIERMNFCVHPEAEAAGYDKMTTIIDIYLKDGRNISGRSDFGKGSPANPMTYEEVADKFMGCADAAKWPERLAKGIISQVRQLEKLDNLSNLMKLCVQQ
jgi:2-methylcitrate dehydratase PrpD